MGSQGDRAARSYLAAIASCQWTLLRTAEAKGPFTELSVSSNSHRLASPDCQRLNLLRCAVRRWSQTPAAIKTATTAAAIISCRTMNRTRGTRITWSSAKFDRWINAYTLPPR
jgi:hypothetical protein